MVSNKIKRCLSLVMALVLSLSLLPLGAMAEEAGDTQSADGTASPAAAAETTPETTAPAVEPTTAPTEGTATNTALDSIQAKMNGILEYYLGTANLTAEEVPALVAGLNPYDTAAAEREIYELDISEELQQLTNTEKQLLVDTNPVFCAFADEVSRKASVEGAISTYTTVNVLDGQVSVADSANSNSVSNGTVTITAKGSLFGKKTNNITITNESGSKAQLSFDYSATSANSFTIAGASAAASGSYSVLLDADGTLSITLVSNSGLSNTTATLKLSNFSLTVAADASNVTIKYDSAYGSVTAGGAGISSGEVLEEITVDEGIALVATPTGGATFHGWIDEADGRIISTAASYTLKPSADVTVKAVFTGAGSAPYFMVGSTSQKSVSSGLLGWSKIDYYTVSGSYIFDDLNKAASAADTSSSKAIVLMNSGTLPAGDYTIPAGVTLLIPFDDANSLYTTQIVNTGSYTKPTPYRTLTMADGANLIINGAMSLSAKQNYADGGSPSDGGSPTGPVSFVNMQGNSTITVNNGGALYAYGYITGSGSVTAKNGATVYEMFQFMDFRGGSQSTDMENGVFPFSQYYVQNIEVPLTLEYGATERAYTTIYMSSADFGTAIGFMGESGCMFNLKSGSVTKKYDGTTDRLYIEANGEMTLSPITMSFGTSSINSKSYELPINSNITVKVKSDSIGTISQDIALLPGAEIIVENGATCTVAEGTSVYFYDADQWGSFCGTGNKKLVPIGYAPGKTYTRTEADLVDASLQIDGTLDASQGYIYTTAGGANIHSTGTGVITTTPGTQTSTHQLVQNTGYTEIPLTPAQLKNGDGSYVATANGGANTYTYVNGKWICANHTWSDGKCSLCSVFKIFGTNLRAGDYLDLFFYVKASDLTEGMNYRAHVTKTFGDGRANVERDIWYLKDDGTKNWAEYPGDLLRFSFDDISAKEMTDEVHVTIYDKDGNQVSNIHTVTIRSYAMDLLKGLTGDNLSQKDQYLRTALIDMLNYGAAAQDIFDYDTGDLANAGCDDYQAYATAEAVYDTTSELPEHNGLDSATVIADNGLTLCLYFNNITSTDGLTAYINYTDHYGKNVSWDTTTFNLSEANLVGVDVTGLAIADGRQMVSCEVKNNSGEKVAYGSYSIERYLASKSDHQVFPMLMKFITSAHNYFHS